LLVLRADDANRIRPVSCANRPDSIFLSIIRRRWGSLMIWCARTRLALHMERREGNAVSATAWGEAMEKILEPSRCAQWSQAQPWQHRLCPGEDHGLARRSTHTEAVTSRDELLLIPAKLVESGRQKTLKLAVGEKWWAAISKAYKRLRRWLDRTAPQLDVQQSFEPYLCWHNPLSPDNWLQDSSA